RQDARSSVPGIRATPRPANRPRAACGDGSWGALARTHVPLTAPAQTSDRPGPVTVGRGARLLIYLRQRPLAGGLNEPPRSSPENRGKVVGVGRARSSYTQKDGQQWPDH